MLDENCLPGFEPYELDVQLNFCDDYGGGSYDGGSSSGSSNQSAYDHGCNNLSPCFNGDADDIGRFLGDQVTCISEWDSKHRVKTKYWQQDVIIINSLGVNTRAQTRKFGIWWASDAYRIHLGIKSLAFTSEAQITNINNLPSMEIRYLGRTYDQFGVLRSNVYAPQNTTLPNLLWDIEPNEWIQGYVNLEALPLGIGGSVNSTLRRRSLNKQLWEAAVSATRSQFGGNPNPAGVVLYGVGDNSTFETSLNNWYRTKNNSHELKWSRSSGGVSITIGTNGNSTFSPSINTDLTQYGTGQADFFGLEQDGSQLLGDRIIFD